MCHSVPRERQCPAMHGKGKESAPSPPTTSAASPREVWGGRGGLRVLVPGARAVRVACMAVVAKEHGASAPRGTQHSRTRMVDAASAGERRRNGGRATPQHDGGGGTNAGHVQRHYGSGGRACGRSRSCVCSDDAKSCQRRSYPTVRARVCARTCTSAEPAGSLSGPHSGPANPRPLHRSSACQGWWRRASARPLVKHACATGSSRMCAEGAAAASACARAAQHGPHSGRRRPQAQRRR